MAIPLIFDMTNLQLALVVFALSLLYEYLRLRPASMGQKVIKVTEITVMSAAVGWLPALIQPDWSDAAVVALTALVIRASGIIGVLAGQGANWLETELVAHKYRHDLEDLGMLGLFVSWLKIYRNRKEAPIVGRTTERQSRKEEGRKKRTAE